MGLNICSAFEGDFLRPWIIWRLQQGSSCCRDSSQRSPSGSYSSIVIIVTLSPLDSMMSATVIRIPCVSLLLHEHLALVEIY
ncbi:hypothetical protein M405DRAFT_827117 [Rhizopogon salebrosus TDB-379]|nr:hypothetical protein M405DRAFT_827117 [Rhizopogon salebrosus TDB-379]